MGTVEYKWCDKYTWQLIEWSLILVSREWENIIVSARKMLRECLNCSRFKSCPDTKRMVQDVDKYNE